MAKNQNKVKILSYQSSYYEKRGYRLGVKFNERLNGQVVSMRYAYKDGLKMRDIMKW